MLGIGRDDRVLLPEFICADVLAPLAAVGATPVWYAVDRALAPATDPAQWPAARAVLAVNYFGGAQDLAPFDAYAARCGATVIEDNAHGFLSRDSNGRWLGCRSRLGIFSFRKSANSLNAAALVANDDALLSRLAAQLPPGASPLRAGSGLKHFLRRLPLAGPPLAGIATAAAQMLREKRTGSAVPLPAADTESAIPGEPAPPQIADALQAFDADAEIRRRHQLYEIFLQLAQRNGAQAVIATLPDGSVPYGFAFRGEAEAIRSMQQKARRRGLDVYRWPALPSTLAAAAPAHYRDVWLVNFLW